MEFTERLKAYFEALDENATWDSVKPLFDDMIGLSTLFLISAYNPLISLALKMGP